MAHAEHSWLEPLSEADPVAASVLKALRARGLPDARDEHWAHAHLRTLGAVRQLAPVTAVAAAAALDAARALLPAALPGFARLVLVDGHPQPALSDGAATGAFEPSGRAGPQLVFEDPDLRYAALATLLATAPLRLHASPGSRAAFELLHLHTGQPGSVYPRLSVRVADGARLTLVERHCGGTAADSLLCTAIDVQVGASAHLELHRLHELGAATLMLDQLQLRLDAAAECRLHQLMAGGANLRHTLCADLAGNAASLHWLGAAVCRGNENHDSLVRVRHAGTGTRAEHRFRALAADRAHVSCSADVLVAASARGARVRQSLRGLIDGRGAQVNLRPRLTINTDDIEAAHGATTGALDERLLFYLLARGIDPEAARAMLKWAFLEEVLGATEAPELRRVAEQLAARHLGDAATHDLAGSLLA